MIIEEPNISTHDIDVTLGESSSSMSGFAIVANTNSPPPEKKASRMDEHHLFTAQPPQRVPTPPPPPQEGFTHQQHRPYNQIMLLEESCSGSSNKTKTKNDHQQRERYNSRYHPLQLHHRPKY
jgi:hypothetical protein